MMRKAVFDTAWIVMNATVNHSNRVIVVTCLSVSRQSGRAVATSMTQKASEGRVSQWLSWVEISTPVTESRWGESFAPGTLYPCHRTRRANRTHLPLG